MTCTLHVAWDERLVDYHFGPGLHQHPADMFPFTGLPAETGGPGAEGTSVNVALPAGTGMPAGSARSTRSSRCCCGSSGRRSWSASMGPTPTGWIPWPSWS